jgi:hypothetical protein
MVAKRPRHGDKAAMIRASLGSHPGFAWMMVAKRPRHGFAMIRASLGSHPGFAWMIKWRVHPILFFFGNDNLNSILLKVVLVFVRTFM